ncbi:MAG: hypothetical protein K2X99_07335, partial [Gemmatimonadaceae bacterium]|nr:hypothetical protein [Gemmatimonadaceae bacterium]
VVGAFLPHRWPIGTGSLGAVVVDDDRVGNAIPLHRVAPAVPGGFRPHFGWTKLTDANAS